VGPLASVPRRDGLTRAATEACPAQNSPGALSIRRRAVRLWAKGRRKPAAPSDRGV